jgi:hypothetical protein
MSLKPPLVRQPDQPTDDAGVTYRMWPLVRSLVRESDQSAGEGGPGDRIQALVRPLVRLPDRLLAR